MKFLGLLFDLSCCSCTGAPKAVCPQARTGAREQSLLDFPIRHCDPWRLVLFTKWRWRLTELVNKSSIKLLF